MSESWLCPHCLVSHAEEALQFCPNCDAVRHASWEIMFSADVLEAMDDGVIEPFAVLTALQSKLVYARLPTPLTLARVARQMRLLTKDTTVFARALAKARASRTMLEVLAEGDAKDKIAVLRGIQVLGDVIEHRGEVVTKHVVELHDGAPPLPARDGDKT